MHTGGLQRRRYFFLYYHFRQIIARWRSSGAFIVRVNTLLCKNERFSSSLHHGHGRRNYISFA